MKRTGAAAEEEGSGCRCKREKGAEGEAAAAEAEEEGKMRARRCVEVAEQEVVMSVRVPLTVAATGNETRSGSEGRGRKAVRAIRSMLKMKARIREV
jgi:hypothetical protein